VADQLPHVYPRAITRG